MWRPHEHHLDNIHSIHLSILRSLILILLPDIQFSTSFHIHLKSSRFHHLSSVVFISIREAAACRCLAVFSLCLVRTSDQQSESDVLKASCLPLLKWHWASGQKKNTPSTKQSVASETHEAADETAEVRHLKAPSALHPLFFNTSSDCTWQSLCLHIIESLGLSDGSDLQRCGLQEPLLFLQLHLFLVSAQLYVSLLIAPRCRFDGAPLWRAVVETL